MNEKKEKEKTTSPHNFADLLKEKGQEAAEAILDEEDKPVEVRQGFVAYLRCMWALLWTTFRYPFETTVIEWSTGKVIGEILADGRPGTGQDQPARP